MARDLLNQRHRTRYREGFFTDGRKLIWEYPRHAPGGDQMDFVESMERNGDGPDPAALPLLGPACRQCSAA